MGRRIPSQVHKAATRLMQGKFINEPPLWYDAVAQYPPLPLPARATKERTAFDLPSSSKSTQNKQHNLKAKPIVYLEDRVRQRFFLDHPFEAFRPKTLVEKQEIQGEHPVKGSEWVRLRQRGRNPTPDDVVNFTVNLHQHHNMPLSQAYRTAVQQYAALRSERSIAVRSAVLEAKAYGATFSQSATEKGYAMEAKSLEEWNQKAAADLSILQARKKWKPVVEKDSGSWSKGQDYVDRWRRDERPSYRPGQPTTSSGSRERQKL